jgi:hypothetical protein
MVLDFPQPFWTNSSVQFTCPISLNTPPQQSIVVSIVVVHNRVVTRTIEDGRTMAAGSSMTWTHCSVRYKVTSGVNRRVQVTDDPPANER